MRVGPIAFAFSFFFSPVCAEVWVSREGECGEWQTQWTMQQETTGVWAGTIEFLRIGGPCAPRDYYTTRREVRAVIAGQNLFAVRPTETNEVCTYVGRIAGKRARGFALCEGGAVRQGFAVRFPEGAQANRQRPLREVPPDDELLELEQSPGGRRFRDRSLDEFFSSR
jgi:hypothetical protein